VSARIELAAVTHRGVVRARNEDFVAAQADIGLAVLADGMGGHNAGEVASRMAVETIVGGIEPVLANAPVPGKAAAESLIAEHIARANAKIQESSGANREHSGMGTTVVVALWHDTAMSIGHVGDSRLYRFRGGELKQLTRDHTLVQQRVDSGSLTYEDARREVTRNVLTRAVGSEPTVEIDLNTYATEPADVYLLCSDGLTEMLPDAHIARLLASHGGQLAEAGDALVDEANARGGVDNISVILVRVLPGSGPRAQ
jgi:serine/threonine protein phosphatase PrpC